MVGGGWGGNGGSDEDGDVRCKGDGLVVNDPRNRAKGVDERLGRLRI